MTSSTFHTPWWAIHRKLYNWVLSFAHSQHSSWALLGLSFLESSVFPIAPDVLQIALTLEKRNKAYFYAFISAVASVLGGIFGYLIGSFFWQFAESFFFSHIFTETTFNRVGHLYNEWNFWAIFVAAFTPIPYKVFTLAAGVFHIAFIPFLIASLVGRSLRFFLVATLLWRYGDSIKEFIEKYFNLISFILMALLLAGFLILREV